MTEKSNKAKQTIDELVKLLKQNLSPEDKEALLDAVNKEGAGVHRVALSIDPKAEPNVAMCAVIMGVCRDMLDNIPDANTGDVINALLNCLANFFLTNVKPGTEQSASEHVVKALEDGFGKITAEANKVYADHPKMLPLFKKLADIMDNEALPDKERDDALEELKDLRDKRNKLIIGNHEVYDGSGKARVSNDSDVRLDDWDKAASRGSVGNA